MGSRASGLASGGSGFRGLGQKFVRLKLYAAFWATSSPGTDINEISFLHGRCLWGYAKMSHLY